MCQLNLIFTNFKKFAFTLAEVLIVLGIIGIVAEMTIPTLVHDIGEKANRTKLLKEYSVISQAYTSIMSDNGGSIKGLCGVEDNDCVNSLFKEKLSYVKECSASHVNGNCWASSWITLNKAAGWDWDDPSRNSAGLILKDGTYIIFYHSTPTCYFESTPTAITSGCFGVVVDVNGDKKPNQLGIDIFRFFALEDRLIPLGSQMDQHHAVNYPCKKNARGDACAAEIIQNIDFVIPES